MLPGSTNYIFFKILANNLGSSIGVSKRDFGTEHWCSACQVYLLRLVVFSLLFSVKILKRLFSVNCVSPTSWQTVAEITLELVQFIKLFKKRMLVAHGASFEQVVYKYFFRKQSLLINVVCVFLFFFWSLRSPRPSIGTR